jgi:PST family polysaccharide transporter
VTTGQAELSQPIASGGLRRSAARSAGVAAGAWIITQVLTFVSYAVLAHLTTPAVFGTFAAGGILLSVGGLFAESGMSSALIQRRDTVEEAAVTALAATFLGSVLLAAIALGLSPVVGIFFHRHQVGLVAAALSGLLVVNALGNVPTVLLQRRLALRRWVVDPLAAIAYGAISAAGLVLGLGVWAFVVGAYGFSVTKTGGYWLAVRWKPNLRLASFAVWRDLARFGRHIVASELLREVMNVASTALIGRFLGTASLARFRFGWRLVGQAVAPTTVANAYTVQSALVRLAHDPARVRAAVLSSFRMVSIVAFPIGALFIPFGDSLAVLLFGEAWRKTGPIMVALAALGIAWPMESVSSEIFKSSGRPDILPRMYVVWAVTAVGLIAAFVHLGPVAVGVAWSISTVCTAVYAITWVPKVVGVRLKEIAAAIFPPLFAALVTAAGIVLINRYVLHAYPRENIATWGRLLGEALAGAVTYLVIVALVARRSLIELRETVKTMIRREAPVATSAP